MRKLAFAAMSMALFQAPSAAQIAVQSSPDASPKCETRPESRFRIRRTADLGRVARIEWLPEAKRLIVTSPDRAAMLIDAASGARLAELSPTGPVLPRVIEVSPNHEFILWRDQGERPIQVRRTSTGELLAQPDLLQHARAMEFSPDSSRIAVLTEAGLALLDAKTGAQVGQTLEVSSDGMRYSADGARLIANSGDRREVAMDVRTGASAYPTAASDGENIRFDGNGERAVATGPGGWRLIDPASGTQLAKGSTGDEVSFVGDDGYIMAQGGADVRIFDAKTGRLAARPGRLATTAAPFVRDFGLQVSPDRQTAVTRSPNGSARLWDLARGRGLAELGLFSVGTTNLPHKDPGKADIPTGPTSTGEFRFTPDGDRLVTRDIAGQLIIWDARSGRRVATIGQFTKQDYLRLADNNSFALAILADNSATLWNTRSGWRIANLGQFSPDPSATRIAISPDNRFLLIGDRQKTELWNIDTGVRVARHEISMNLNDAVFSASGEWLTLRPKAEESAFDIWNARTGKQAGEARPADQVTFYTVANEDVLLARSAAAFALWDLKRGERAVVCQFSDPNLSLMDVFSVDDALLLALNVGGSLSELWSIERL